MRLRTKLHFLFLLVQARAACTLLNALHLKRRDSPHVVIAPADPVSVVGSKGDEAMIEALCSELVNLRQSEYPKFTFLVAPGSDPTDLNIKSVSFVKIWGGVGFVVSLLIYLLRSRPGHAFVIGADVMDGSYSPVNSLRMLIFAEMAAAMGVRSTVTGFSFNSNCPVELRKAYQVLGKRANYNIRDAVSFEVFRTLVKNSKLVADLAFLVRPTAASELVHRASQWVKIKKNEGRLVVALNFHPMLFKSCASNSEYQEFSESIKISFRKLVSEDQCAILLVPHDNRDFAGDKTSLLEFFNNTKDEFGDDVMYFGTPPSASDLKTVASFVDLVVTGRMHFCIAALGMGVPVVAFAYQAKFAGLFRHFDLPQKYILDPSAVTGESLLILIKDALFNRYSLRSLVELRLPIIKKLSLSNLS